MLTKLTIRNFKRFGEIEVELDNPVVFAGPKNSGKPRPCMLWPCGTWASSDGMKSLQARTLRKRAQGQQSTAGICLQFPIRVPAICGVICTSGTSGTLQNARGQKRTDRSCGRHTPPCRRPSLRSGKGTQYHG